MSILKVARMGHPVLRRKAREVSKEEIRSPAMQKLIADMIETMGEYSGIGLAAPQVHESIQLALVHLDEENPRYDIESDGETSGLHIIFNPKTTVLDSTEQGFWEGCLSVPELRGLVYRPRKVQVDFLDQHAKPRRFVAEGFLATVFQHELDHLQGVLYVDRIKDTTRFAFLEEYQRYWIPEEDEEIGELEE